MPWGGDENGERARDDEDHEVEGVHFLAADAVGEETEQSGPEEDTDQRRCPYQAAFGGGGVQLFGDSEQCHADDAHDVAVEERAAAAGNQDAGVEAALGGAVHYIEWVHGCFTSSWAWAAGVVLLRTA